MTEQQLQTHLNTLPDVASKAMSLSELDEASHQMESSFEEFSFEESSQNQRSSFSPFLSEDYLPSVHSSEKENHS